MPNPKMIYHLRNTTHPLPESTLVQFYDDASHFAADIQHLSNVGLVRLSRHGFVWEGPRMITPDVRKLSMSEVAQMHANDKEELAGWPLPDWR